jgi:ABC-type transport system involved in multi-copper enzyme maturation permease subunit
VLQPWILRLLVVAIALPILMCILFGLAYLLTALGDEAGAADVVWVNLVLAVLWVFDMLLLVIALALAALADKTTDRVVTTEEIIGATRDDELKV